jgi:hypothetical protein
VVHPTVSNDTVPSPTAAPKLTSTSVISNEENLAVFEAVWNTVDRTYFDPDFGGLDWDAVHDEYEPRVAAAGDEETLYQLLNQMLWELNVSHTGVGPADMWSSIEPVAFEKGKVGIDGIPIEQIIADAQGRLSPPFNKQGRIGSWHRLYSARMRLSGRRKNGEHGTDWAFNH